MNDNGNIDRKIYIDNKHMALKEMRTLLLGMYELENKLLLLGDPDTIQFRHVLNEFQREALKYTYRLL